ncbi:MAG TPA: cutinase family protein [Mycobacterium sp.]|nr:cutinase family protein [Mycobacterium sp.]
MRAYHISRFLGVAVVTIWTALLGPPIPSASAEPCPDVEAVFARGTGEPTGVGGIGQAFIDSLHSQLGSRSFQVYPVNYPASSDFGSGAEFARTVVEGIRDAATHIEDTAATCPKTRIVLGGYSQGAALAGYVTSAEIPKEVPAEYRAFIPEPMPPEIANHVAAVTLFGTPSAEFLTQNGAPPITIGPSYVPKTLQLCAPDDTICSGDPGGGPPIGHAMYALNGMAGQAADFAVGHL